MTTPVSASPRRLNKKSSGGGKRTIALLFLFAVLLGCATYFELTGQEKGARNTPSANSSQKEGALALFRLYKKEGLAADQLRSPWTDLKSTDSLLVFAQPTDPSRPIGSKEAAALDRWVKAGGTFLGIVAPPPLEQPFDSKDPVTGDAAVYGVPPTTSAMSVDSTLSPLLESVKTLYLDSPVRLRLAPKSAYKVLASDRSGAPYFIRKPYGKGQVVILANRSSATNSGIEKEDNAILLFNIARLSSSGDRQTIQFDEYHHGIGFAKQASEENPGVWENFPPVVKALFIEGVVFTLLLIYNGNRRFGDPKTTAATGMRSSTDYVASMARLYRKAGAADIAFEMLYRSFLRDLKKRLEIEPDALPVRVIETAAKRLNAPPAQLNELVYRGEAVISGDRMTEKELLYYTKKIEDFRRTYNIVGV